MPFAVFGIGLNSHLYAGYTDTKDYLAVASRWKIPLPRIEKPAVNGELVSNHQQSFFYIPFWSLEKDLFNVHLPMPQSFLVPRARHVLTWGNEKSLLSEDRKLFWHGRAKNKQQTPVTIGPTTAETPATERVLAPTTGGLRTIARMPVTV
jgi:hypothetical protein